MNFINNKNTINNNKNQIKRSKSIHLFEDYIANKNQHTNNSFTKTENENNKYTPLNNKKKRHEKKYKNNKNNSSFNHLNDTLEKSIEYQ